MGAVCATGASVEDFWTNATNGVCGTEIRTIKANDGTEITVPVAQADAWRALNPDLGRDIARADDFSKFAAFAADEAVKASGLDFAERDLGGRTATIIGTGIGGQSSLEDTYINMLCFEKRPHPLTILRLIPNAAASHLSIRYGLRGPAFAISSACASGAHAIGVAADLIRAGSCDAAVAGASEAIINKGALQAWKQMHILSDGLCRPFSKNRKGLIIGEGAGVLVLEEYERAKARGATIHAEILGFGMNADGKDMINPAVEGAAAAMQAALAGVRLPDAAKIYVNAHGTGTLMNDPTETKAIRATLGADADHIAVSSTKAMHGHLLGAAGGVESIMAIKALGAGVVPPTINYDVPDPECDLDVTPNEARERPIELAISNSFAFGGLNAVLAFGRV
ncbi:MAG: beta-ACP synthase [Alphaproteobacteria bacterium]|nr:beta-ACP synthase [Alphaproteobacteria bacterium]